MEHFQLCDSLSTPASLTCSTTTHTPHFLSPCLAMQMVLFTSKITAEYHITKHIACPPSQWLMHPFTFLSHLASGQRVMFGPHTCSCTFDTMPISILFFVTVVSSTHTPQSQLQTCNFKIMWLWELITWPSMWLITWPLHHNPFLSSYHHHPLCGLWCSLPC